VLLALVTRNDGVAIRVLHGLDADPQLLQQLIIKRLTLERSPSQLPQRPSPLDE
jgi:hypothetical protein